MQMKTGVEQSVCALMILHMLPEKAVLPGEVISQRIGASPTYFQKLLRKLVSADLITSVAGSKGGFRLKRKPEHISIYDVYVAVEGQQSLYSSCGIIEDVLQATKDSTSCLLTHLMEEAEHAWQKTLKSANIATMIEQMSHEKYKSYQEELKQWITEKMVM